MWITFGIKEMSQGFTKIRSLHCTEYRNNIIGNQRVNDISLKTKTKKEKIISDAKMGLQFGRISDSDSTLNNMVANIYSRKRKDNSNQIIVEGRNLIKEAIKCNLKMDVLMFSRNDKLSQLNDEIGTISKLSQIPVYKVPQQMLKMWSVLKTPPGLLGIFRKPTSDDIKKKSLNEEVLPITVICDNIREPNNLGSIIRTCAAIPCHQVIVMKGCCDPWQPKALRGGCGAQFYIKIFDDIQWNTINLSYLPEPLEDCCVFLAENNLTKLRSLPFELNTGQNPTIYYNEIKENGKHTVVIIGGESHGVSVDAYRLFNCALNKSKIVHIPLASGIDSLNAAAALTLILYELKKNKNT